jgi:hypothetical protein
MVALLVLGTLSSACAPGPSTSGGIRFSLQQKGHFQALYDANGQMLRLLQDTDGDGRAEVVVVFGPKGKPERGEMDTDGDGVVDRREHFAPDGTLTRVEVMNVTAAAPSPERTPSNDLKPIGDP